jgi:hypothetical protein
MQSISIMLKSNEKMVIEQTLWFIGNIIGENEELRDLVLRETVLMETLQRLIEMSRIAKTLLKTAVWVNSNIARYKHLSEQENLICFHVAKAGIFTEDTDIISDALWTISYLADTPDDKLIDYFSSEDVIVKIVENLDQKDLSLFVPALRCIGNILTANEPTIIERCILVGVLDKLTNLLFQSNS